MNVRQITTLWSTVVVEELIRQGAGFFCISPGSRSTPLTAAVARNPRARFRIFVDERSAGFFALGHARATHKPAVLVCTSGTALANYFPSVVEADADARPMIILSADRPFELLECGANQTIRQQNIFGSCTRWSFGLPSPSTDTPLPSLLSTVDEAVRRSLSFPAGPVHLNVPFREPIDPEPPDWNDPWVAPITTWQESSRPWSAFSLSRKEVPEEELSRLRTIVSEAANPLLVAGNMGNNEEAGAILSLSRSLGIPLFADLTSGLRFSHHCLPWQLAFQSTSFISNLMPDVVVHFGGALIGKQPGMAIRGWAPQHYIVVRSHPARFSPDHNVTLSIEASPASVAMALHGCRNTGTASTSQLEQAFFSKAGAIIETCCAPGTAVSELSAARIVSQLIDRQSGLFVSNSMPARDMDMYADHLQDEPTRVALNRGASGIDGIISTAAGFAAGLRKPVTLMIGDLAFLHDLNALSLLGDSGNRLIVVVLNNNGGGIFSFLPIAAETGIFEQFFATPQDYSIRASAETFGLAHTCPRTNAEFAASYTAALQSERSSVIEVCGTREENFRLHQQLKSSVIAAADSITLH